MIKEILVCFVTLYNFCLLKFFLKYIDGSQQVNAALLSPVVHGHDVRETPLMDSLCHSS